MTRIQRYLPWLVAGLVLAGCGGGDSQRVTFPEQHPGGEIFFSYPDAGQTEVSIHAPLIVRASRPIVNAENLTQDQLRLRAGDTTVPVTVSVVAEGQSLVIRPQQPLAFGTDYRLEITGLEGEEGPIVLPGDSLAFTTRLASKGPKSERIASDNFVVTRMFPDGEELPLLDFSSVRFQFSQPIDTRTVEYGSSVALEDGDGELVEATVLAKGTFLTIDPITDLSAEETYTLRLSPALASEYEVALQAPFDGSHSYSFTPLATTPRETMVLYAPASGAASQLTGETVNLVPVVSTLLGDNTQSQQQGDVYSELAFVPNFPEATPMRIPRGSMLAGDALEVNIGGEVPAGFDSGDVMVHFISDATGYLLPAPYSTSEDAPRQLRVFMDVAITTGSAQANAAFNQDVLHLELIGQAIVEDGILVADALTVVESEVLGLETAFGTLSFRMEAYRDQQNAPSMAEDTRAPQLQSWLPGGGDFPDNVSKQRPGDPILLHFDEPLHPGSLDGALRVTENGATAPFEHYFDGVTLVINTALAYGAQYQIELGDGITDLSGNPLPTQTLSFTMPHYQDVGPIAPLPLITYPGFPCVTTGRDLANGSAGYCLGGMATDDRLPLPRMPAGRDIEVRFSQLMDLDSIVLGQSLRIERVDVNGTFLGEVSGKLMLRDRLLRFTPDEPWEDGVLYRYVLASNGDGRSSACTPGAMICSADGLPLQTRTLAQTPAEAPAIDGGGPDLEIYFRGAPPTHWVFQSLVNLPTADVNGNAVRDPGEENAVDNAELEANSARIEVLGTGGAVTAAEIGCLVGEDCPREKYLYLTGALNGDVVGYLSPDQIDALIGLDDPLLPPEVVSGGGVLVYLYPTAIRTSEAVVYADASIGEASPASTGPQTMRMRPTCDARGAAAAPNPPNSSPIQPCGPDDLGLVPGWIVEGSDGPEFVTRLNLYLDSPALEPKVHLIPGALADLLDTVIGTVIGAITDLLGLGTPPPVNEVIAVPLAHNQRSFGFDLALRGPLTFHDDGRMEIKQLNLTDVPLNVQLNVLGLLDAEVSLLIPAGGTNLNYISMPAKM